MSDMRSELEPFGNVGNFPRVAGKCPACRRDSLFLASGGFVTCSIIGCADPGMASDILAKFPPASEAELRAKIAAEIRAIGQGVVPGFEDYDSVEWELERVARTIAEGSAS